MIMTRLRIFMWISWALTCWMSNHRSDKQDILNVRKGNSNTEILHQGAAPKPALPAPEHTGLRHLAFRVTDVEEMLWNLTD